jgi:hypothetical protein
MRIQIYGCGCVQRWIDAYLTCFGWNNTHLFTVKLSHKGDSIVGATTLCEAMDCLIFPSMIKPQIFMRIDGLKVRADGTMVHDPVDFMFAFLFLLWFATFSSIFPFMLHVRGVKIAFW